MNPAGVLKKSLFATRLVHGVRAFRDRSRHHELIKKYGLTHFMSGDWQRSEERARDALRRAESSTQWMPRPIYPFGGAAGPLLLYLLLRSLAEFPVRRVLELGAGQSTLVLDAWARSTDGQVTSFEENEWWADAVARKVADGGKTRVLWLPAEPGPRGSWYRSPSGDVVPDGGFDMILVDGPVGTRRFSRYGIVEHIPDWSAKEWLVIWDDLDRPGDLESFGELVDRLRTRGVEHDHVLLDGDRTVGLAFTAAFRAARYFW